MSLLARLFPCRPRPLAVQLAESRHAQLLAERRVSKAEMALRDSQDLFVSASRRAEKMEALAKTWEESARYFARDRDQLLAERAQQEAVVAQALVETATTARMVENLTDIADGLRNELKAVKARKGKR